MNFSALDAGDTDTKTLDYLSLDRISPVLDAHQPIDAVNQVCIHIVFLLFYYDIVHKVQHKSVYTYYFLLLYYDIVHKVQHKWIEKK